MIFGLTAALLVLAAGFSAPAAAQTVPEAAVLEAVNALRTAQGQTELRWDAQLAEAAAVQAEYLAENNLLSSSGPQNSSPTSRAQAASYGGGEVVIVLEVVAKSQRATTPQTLVQQVWTRPVDRAALLNRNAVHLGAAVVEVNGQVFTVVDIGYLESGAVEYTIQPTLDPRTPRTPTATINPVVPVLTSAPREDGSIIHEVAKGQALSTIAEAYGIFPEVLAALNNIDLKEPLIFEGQKLLVRPQFTATVSPTVTRTLRPPTRTPRPTFTTGPTRPPGTATLSPTPSPEPPAPAPPLTPRRLIGVILVTVSGLGIAVVLLLGLRKKP